MLSPTIASAAMAVMLIGLLASGQAAARLGHAIRQPLGAAALAMIVLIAVAMLWAEVPWRERWDAFISWRKLWVVLIALALLGPEIWKRRVVVGYVGICAVVVTVSFAFVAAQGLPTSVFDPAGSLLRNHSAQSMALATATFFALWLAASASLSPTWRRAAASFAALFVVNLAFVTPGRSGYLALAVMLAVLAVTRLRERRQVLIVLVLGALFAGAIWVSPVAQEGIASARDEWNNAAVLKEPTRVGIRVVMYENTLEIVRERPLLGTGTGGFGRAYSAHVKAKYGDWRQLPTADPHNQYLHVLAEQGVIGLLMFLAYIAAGLLDRSAGSTRVLAVGMLLAWSATSMLSGHFKTFAEGYLLALVLGTMLARPVPQLDHAETANFAR